MRKEYYLLEDHEGEKISTQESQKMKFLDNLFENGGDFQTSHTTLDKSLTKEMGSDSNQKIQTEKDERFFDDFSILLIIVFITSILVFLYFFTFKWSLIASLILLVMLVEIRKYFILYDDVLNRIKDRNSERAIELECISKDYNLMEI